LKAFQHVLPLATHNVFATFFLRSGALRHVCKQIKTLSSDIFKPIVSCVVLHNVPIQHLDLEVMIKNGAAVVNPSLLKVSLPLCPTSEYNSSVHSAWPGAVASRMWNLSDTNDPQSAVRNMLTLHEMYK
jgi:hypothetical protein